MKAIGIQEQSCESRKDGEYSGRAWSSLFPERPPNAVTTTHEKEENCLEKTKPWLPCHYFDYIAGTSTGGLIAIMLGRLRMNIDDCIVEYENLGSKIFAHPRWFHYRTALFWAREKYDHKILKNVISEVVDNKVPKINKFPGGKTFACDENRCRV